MIFVADYFAKLRRINCDIANQANVFALGIKVENAGALDFLASISFEVIAKELIESADD